MKKKISHAVMVALVFVGAGIARGQKCPSLDTAQKTTLSRYIAEQYELSPDLTLSDEGTVHNSCFRRIRVNSVAPARTMDLFLSPDGRYLTDALHDISINPKIERMRAAEETAKQLTSGNSPLQGAASAKYSIVVFSDFQCPFCKRLEDSLDALPADARKEVKIVFKHRPLQMHAWAKNAALASICIARQNNAAFWTFARFLFDNQGTITPENFEDSLAKFTSQADTIDKSRLHGCLQSKDAEEELRKDEQLADTYHIDIVPTLFVNGTRTMGAYPPEELVRRLRSGN